ncbi:MAG: LON peptidase substrate-binding domain-containing protein [Abditibacteriaceae bacterium]
MHSKIPILLLDMVLFPGMPLPLHIFEPRYRLMIQRCLDADGIFGVALPRPETQEFLHALPVGVGTSTHITQVFPLPEGHFNLQTSGQQRFLIHNVQIVDDYPVAEIDWIDDIPTEKNLTSLASNVDVMAQKYFRGLAAESGLDLSSQEPIVLPQDPYELSMWVAAALPMQSFEKQPLLEQTSTSLRLEYLLRYLQREDMIRRAAIKQGIVGDRFYSWDPHASLN